MNKGVSNLPSYQRVCRAANDRYLNALSVVNDPTPAYQQVADLTESKTHRGRRYAGFNPARKDDVSTRAQITAYNYWKQILNSFPMFARTWASISLRFPNDP